MIVLTIKHIGLSPVYFINLLVFLYGNEHHIAVLDSN